MSTAITSAILITSLVSSVPSQARRGCGSPTRAEAVDRLPSGHGEVSGFVASRRHRGLGWMIRDSGHPASLYAVWFGKGGPWVREVQIKGAENTEASFFWKDDLVLVTKTSPARVYRFDDAIRTDRVNRPRYVGKLEGAKRVSVARPSPDLATLVTSDHETITVFKSAGPGGPLSQFTYEPPARRKTIGPDDNIEAGDYFPHRSCDMVMLSERRNVYRLRD